MRSKLEQIEIDGDGGGGGFWVEGVARQERGEEFPSNTPDRPPAGDWVAQHARLAQKAATTTRLQGATYARTQPQSFTRDCMAVERREAFFVVQRLAVYNV